MQKERVAAGLRFETSTDELVKLWFATEEEKRAQQNHDGEGWHKGWEHFFAYVNFKILFETGGDGLERFGNRIGDLMRDPDNLRYSDFMRFYVNSARCVMKAEKPGTKRYVEAWQLINEMKYTWLAALEKARDPFIKLKEAISFVTEFKPENGVEMIEAQAKKVMVRLPEYRLVATIYPFPGEIEGLPEGYMGKKKVEANKKANDHWYSMTWLAAVAKEKGMTAVYERMDAYLLGALGNIDIRNTDGEVVECLLKYYADSDHVSEGEKREMVAKCLSAFAGKEGYHGEARVVVGAIEAMLTLSDFEGAIALWKQYPEHADECILPSLMSYAAEHDLVERLRAERSWFSAAAHDDSERNFSKWRLDWTFAARRLANDGKKFDYTMPEILEEVEGGTTDVRTLARIVRSNPDQVELAVAVGARLEREIEKVLSWKQENEWEHFPYGDLQECIEAILFLRGELLS